MQLSLSLDPHGAVFSLGHKYRYWLFRRWAEGSQCCFICLNPSTADADHDDPSVRRMIGFARSWGHGALVVGNLFAWRATDPKEICVCDRDPVGPLNDEWLQRMASESDLVVAAWGNHGDFQGRGQVVRAMIGGMYSLGLTKSGQPKHPLYVAAATHPVLWETKP